MIRLANIVIILIILFLILREFKKRAWYRAIRYYTPTVFKNWYLSRYPRSQPFKIVGQYNINPNDDKILSTSLYGHHPIYFDGSIQRAKEVKRLMPGWKLRIYCHDKVDQNHIKKLIDHDVQVVIVNDPEIKPKESAGAFWRFMPLAEDITFISIDLDNTIPQYLLAMTRHWENQPEPFMRESRVSQTPWPKFHTLGGFFGKKKGSWTIPAEWITHYKLRNPFGSDEYFLANKIIPLALEYGMVTYYSDQIVKFMRTWISPGRKLIGNRDIVFPNHWTK